MIDDQQRTVVASIRGLSFLFLRPQKNQVRLALVFIILISSVRQSSHAPSFSGRTAGIDVKRPLRIVGRAADLT